MLSKQKIVIHGAGDRGTAVALRLFRSGFRPVLTEHKQPGNLYSFRNFSDVVYLGNKSIENIESVLINFTGHADPGLWQEVDFMRNDRKIPLLNLDAIDQISDYGHRVVIVCPDVGEQINELEWENYDCVIRLGPKFQVGRDGHFVVGTAGREQGIVYRVPQELECEEKENHHLSRSPMDGVFIAVKEAGDKVREKDVIGTLNDINILSPGYGEITGILHSGHFVAHGQPLFEIRSELRVEDNYRNLPVACHAIAGGVLEAALAFLSENGFSD